MSVVMTDLRNTRQKAKEIAYNPTGAVTAKNVQDAIDQLVTLPKSVVTMAVTFAMSPFTPAGTDSYLAVDTSGGAITINMPASASRGGLPLTIKDVTGNAAANPITVARAGAETIDGLTSYPLDAAYAAATFVPKTGGYLVGP